MAIPAALTKATGLQNIGPGTIFDSSSYDTVTGRYEDSSAGRDSTYARTAGLRSSR